MASQDNTARIRTMFGNFDIQETIGQGGMGVVYRAKDVTLGRDVALKVLKDELRENSRVVARFKREAEAIASLDHPRIVQVYSVGSVGSIPYFAMEFIEGKPLNRILRRHKFLHWKPALQIARDVAEALEAAHEAGIIHRDIKPGNILVDRSGHAYVSDFGIAKVLSAETQLTVDGSKLGTPQYMSPERVQSHEITIESDLYSLGVVLFQMLTGRLPYDAHDPVELIRMIVVEPPRRLRDYKPELPEDIERLVAYMIEKKPQDRPASAAQVVELINRLLDGKALFESDSGIDEALEELREEVATPSPESTADRAPSPLDVWSRATAYAALRWRGLSDWGRVAIIAVPLVLAGLVAGQVIASVGGVDSAPEIARDFSTDPSEWYTAGELIGFESTPAGVRANVLLDGYRVGEVGWASSGVVVELRGPDGMGLALLNPNERRTELLATVGSWDPNASVVLYRPDSRTGVIASTRDGREFELRLATFDAAVKLQSAAVIARRVVRIAIHPDGDRICMVRREGRHGRIVEEYGLDGSNRAGTVLFASQQELAGLSYGAGGDAIVFQEETESGLETNIFYGGEGRRRLTLGDGRLSQNALNASGDRLIVIEGEEDTRGLLYDAVTGTQLTNLGGMVDAGWTHHDSVAYLAPDESGALQIWRLPANMQARAEQRSFVTGGVQAMLRIHPENGSILAVSADSASVLISGP